MSPSVWRVWIEIISVTELKFVSARSPSVWRVWIEIAMVCQTIILIITSPSVWRVWIEISPEDNPEDYIGSPSVWRVWIEMFETSTGTYIKRSHPPCGGCGLKFG